MIVKKNFAETEDGMAENKNGMADNKNVKVPVETHQLLISRAKALGMKYYVLADALLSTGLQMSDQALHETVVNTRQLTVKRQKVDTSQEQKQPQSSPPASSDE